MTISSMKVRASIIGVLTKAVDAGTASIDIEQIVNNTLTDGTGADQGNAVYVDDFSIGASSSSTIDLAGSLSDPLGNTIVFTAVKAILIIADDTNVNNVIVGNATNAFVGPFGAGTHTLAIKPGGVLLVTDGFSAAGWTVGAGSTDELKLANSSSGTAVTGTIVVIREA